MCPESLRGLEAETEFTHARALPTTLIISPVSGALTASTLPFCSLSTGISTGALPAGSAQL